MPSTFMSIPIMLLAVCQTEKITIKARHIAKLSIYLLIEPSVNLFLALEIKSNEASPNTTVVMLTIVKYTINLHLLYLSYYQKTGLARQAMQGLFPFQAL